MTIPNEVSSAISAVVSGQQQETRSIKRQKMSFEDPLETVAKYVGSNSDKLNLLEINDLGTIAQRMREVLNRENNPTIQKAENEIRIHLFYIENPQFSKEAIRDLLQIQPEEFRNSLLSYIKTLRTEEQGEALSLIIELVGGVEDQKQQEFILTVLSTSYKEDPLPNLRLTLKTIKDQKITDGYHRSLILIFNEHPMEKSDLAIQALLELKEWFPKSFIDELIPEYYYLFLSGYQEISTTEHSKFIEIAEKIILAKPLAEKVPKIDPESDIAIIFSLAVDDECTKESFSTIVTKTLALLPDGKVDHKSVDGIAYIYATIYSPTSYHFLTHRQYEIMPYLNNIPPVDLLAFLQTIASMSIFENKPQTLLEFFNATEPQLDKEHLIKLLKGPYPYGLTLLHMPEFYQAAKPLIEKYQINLSTITTESKYSIDSGIYSLLSSIRKTSKDYLTTFLANRSSEVRDRFLSIMAPLRSNEQKHIITSMQNNPQFSLDDFFNNTEKTSDPYSRAIKLLCAINGVAILEDQIRRIRFDLFDSSLDAAEIIRICELMLSKSVDDTHFESFHSIVSAIYRQKSDISYEDCKKCGPLLNLLSNNELLTLTKLRYYRLASIVADLTREECLNLIDKELYTRTENLIYFVCDARISNRLEEKSLLPNLISLAQAYGYGGQLTFYNVIHIDLLPLDILCSFLCYGESINNEALFINLMNAKNPTEVFSNAVNKRGSITDPYHSSLILYFEINPHDNSSNLISEALEAKKLGIDLPLTREISRFIERCELFIASKPLIKKLKLPEERKDLFCHLNNSNQPKQVIKRLIEIFPGGLPDFDTFYSFVKVLSLTYSDQVIPWDTYFSPFDGYKMALEMITPAELVLFFNRRMTNSRTILQTGDNFAKVIELNIIQRLNKDELMAVLTETNADGKTLLHYAEHLKKALPLMKEKGINPNDIPNDEFGLSIFEHLSTLADSWIKKPKLDSRLMNPVQNYEKRALKVKNMLLKAWDKIPFASMPEATKSLLLEVNNNVQTKEAVRENLVSMLDKLQNRTVWLGTPDADHQDELLSFYDEQLICFENIAEVFKKVNNPQYRAGLLVSIASPEIEGRCGTAYMDELNQKVEVINPELAPKDLRDRLERCANKALFAFTQKLVSKLHENDVHASRQYKYVCGLASCPDDLWYSVAETKKELLDHFSLISFLDDLNFSDELCDLYLEEYVISELFGENLIQLANSCQAQENQIKANLNLPKPQLDKISSMKTTLKFLYKENFRDASKENLIERAFQLAEKALPGVNINEMVAKPLDQLSNQDVNELRENLTELVNSRARAYIQNSEPEKYRAENAALFNLLNALDGILVFDREIAPLNLNKSDRVAAFKARLSLEQAYLKMGRTLQEKHDISFDLKTHGSPSEAVRKARLIQFLIEKIAPKCTYYKKLLYIAQSKGMLTQS
jgi:hypothetical protein